MLERRQSSLGVGAGLELQFRENRKIKTRAARSLNITV
jgi:hypothetical protein